MLAMYCFGLLFSLAFLLPELREPEELVIYFSIEDDRPEFFRSTRPVRVQLPTHLTTAVHTCGRAVHTIGLFEVR